MLAADLGPEPKLARPHLRAFNQQAFYAPILFPLKDDQVKMYSPCFIFILFSSLEWSHLDLSQISKNMDFLFKE